MGPFAGKPAPTRAALALRQRGTCGSGLAREGAGSANLFLACAAPLPRAPAMMFIEP